MALENVVSAIRLSMYSFVTRSAGEADKSSSRRSLVMIEGFVFMNPVLPRLRVDVKNYFLGGGRLGWPSQPKLKTPSWTVIPQTRPSRAPQSKYQWVTSMFNGISMGYLIIIV